MRSNEFTKINENFADGKNPQDKGDSARHGIPKKASLASLDKMTHAGGRKGQLAHWQANMRRGRAKNEGEGDPEGVPHLTDELIKNIIQQVGTEGAHAIVKSLQWGDGAAKELLKMIVKDLKQNIGMAESVKQRLDPKCWKGKHKEGTKIKGGVRVNNCVPNEGLNEFAPPGSSDGGNDGFSEETLKRLAAQWWNGDEDPRVEQTLEAAGWEIGQDEGYDNGGAFVVQAGDINGNSYISWPAEELEGLSEGSLNEFATGADDEDGGEDPYRHPKPEHYARSIDYFGQFEADHFDRQTVDDATGVFKGYWGDTQIAYFKFDNPAKTDSDDPGMGWYYEPQNESVAEASLGNVLSWPEVANKVNSAMRAMGWKGSRKDDNSFMFSTAGQESDDQYYIVVIENEGDNMFHYALGTFEGGRPDIGEEASLPTTEASVSELMNAIREGFGLHEGLTPDQQFDMIEEMVEQVAAEHGVDPELIWEEFDSVDDTELFESAAWRRKAGKNKKGGLNAKGVASYRRENPGSKLQTAVTTKPSKLKKGSKAAKRRKSFCARMGGVKGPMKKNGKPTRKALALRKWNC